MLPKPIWIFRYYVNNVISQDVFSCFPINTITDTMAIFCELESLGIFCSRLDIGEVEFVEVKNIP